MNEKAVKRSKTILDAYLDGKLKPSLSGRILAWFKGEAHTAEKYAALEELWNKYINENGNPGKELIADFNEMAKKLGFPEMEYKQYSFPEQIRKSKPLWVKARFSRVAAVLLPFLVVTGAIYLWVNGARDTADSDLLAKVTVTATAEAREVTLPDGSKVWLGGNSSLSYPEKFNDERDVELDGEAYFSVVSVPNAPFVVKAGEMSVRVLGTEFNVNAFASHGISEVILDKGSVEVAIESGTVVMQPGETLAFDKSAQTLSVTKTPLNHVDWRIADLDFKGASLGRILSTLAGYYDMELDVAPIADTTGSFYIRFTGNETPDEALALLRSLIKGFDFDIEGNKININK